jgi:hypothetical protein
VLCPKEIVNDSLIELKDLLKR